MGIFYSLCHRAQARAEQPADGEEGGGDVDEEEGEGGDENVEVKKNSNTFRNPSFLLVSVNTIFCNLRNFSENDCFRVRRNSVRM